MGPTLWFTERLEYHRPDPSLRPCKVEFKADMLCVECGSSVSSLYTYYSKDNIKATTCEHCGKFADKYIECDQVLVFLDLLLLKPPAMRHVVFNVFSPTEHEAKKIQPEARRLLILMILFNVYLQWAWAEKSSDPRMVIFLAGTSPLGQYMAFLAACTLDTTLVHLIIRSLACYWFGWTQPGALSTAIMLSAAAKLLPIFTLIWDYNMPIVNSMVWWAFAIIMVEVLQVVLGCGYARAGTLVAIALGLRWALCELYWHLILPLPLFNSLTK